MSVRELPSVPTVFVRCVASSLIILFSLLGKPCAPISSLQPDRVVCQLPPGAGSNQSVIVTSNGLSSPVVTLVSYAEPVVTGISVRRCVVILILFK